jgi:hypothetical protein
MELTHGIIFWVTNSAALSCNMYTQFNDQSLQPGLFTNAHWRLLHSSHAHALPLIGISFFVTGKASYCVKTRHITIKVTLYHETYYHKTWHFTTKHITTKRDTLSQSTTYYHKTWRITTKRDILPQNVTHYHKTWHFTTKHITTKRDILP